MNNIKAPLAGPNSPMRSAIPTTQSGGTSEMAIATPPMESAIWSLVYRRRGQESTEMALATKVKTRLVVGWSTDQENGTNSGGGFVTCIHADPFDSLDPCSTQ